VSLPAYLPLALYRGDSYHYHLVLDADLTGATAAGEVHQGDEVITLVCEVLAPDTVSVKLPADAWGAVAPGRGQWDCQLTLADGQVQTIVTGPVKIAADVTP
jgi:hypothetical protein